MSESNRSDAVSDRHQFDDRIDIETRIGNLEVLRILGRCLTFLGDARGYLVAKIALGLLALIPGLFATWMPKLVIDQVLLGVSIDDVQVPFPPHVQVFVDLIRDLSPMGMMMAITAFLILLLLAFGRYEMEGGFAQGEDSATQSENRMNAGESVASGLIGLADTLVHIRFSQRLTNSLRTRLFTEMGRLPMTVMDNHRIGDAVYRVMYDAPMIPDVCFKLTAEPILALTGTFLALWMINYTYGAVAPELVWGAAALIPVGFLITVPFSGLARGAQQDSRAAGAATTNAMEESLANIAAVQSLGGMAKERDRIDKRSAESFRRFRHIKLVALGLEFLTIGTIVVFGFWVYVFVTDQIIEGTMTAGDWSVLFALTLQIGGTALGIGTFWISLQGNAAAVRRVFFFIDIESEARMDGKPVAAVQRSVQIEDVSFTYPDGTRALRHIDLELKSGELTAIVGPTGSGKTSLAWLIPRFIEPTDGRVLCDGKDLSDLGIDALRDQVTYVFQEHMLLSTSVRENLLLANPDADESAMRQALESAGALAFVNALPDGLVRARRRRASWLLSSHIVSRRYGRPTRSSFWNPERFGISVIMRR